MRLRLILALGGLAVLTAGCSGDTADKSDSGSTGAEGGDGEDGDDGSDGGTVEPVYPTGARVLLYYGNGGYAPAGDTGAFTNYEALVEGSTDWLVDHRETWTEDLSDYRVVVFLAMGHDGGEVLTDDQLQTLVDANAAGTRLVFAANVASCDSAVMADTLSRLGVGISYTGEAPDPSYVAVVSGDDLSPNHQLTAGLDEVRFRAPCWVSGGSPIAQASNNNAVVASQLLPSGGEVIVMGDFGVIDDAGDLEREDLDNGAFGIQLAAVDPSL